MRRRDGCLRRMFDFPTPESPVSTTIVLIKSEHTFEYAVEGLFLLLGAVVAHFLHVQIENKYMHVAICVIDSLIWS